MSPEHDRRRRRGRDHGNPAALPLFERPGELDPQFAMAFMYSRG
jgi:hypothetical protein